MDFPFSDALSSYVQSNHTPHPQPNRSVGFAHEIYHSIIKIRQQPNLLSSRGQSPRYSSLQRQLVPSPVRRGKVRMGGFMVLGKIKFMKFVEPPSPSTLSHLVGEGVDCR